MKCPSCGMEVASGKFCENCGAPLQTGEFASIQSVQGQLAATPIDDTTSFNPISQPVAETQPYGDS